MVITRYEKQTYLRIGSLEVKFRKHKVLVSSFSTNVVCDCNWTITYNTINVHLSSI